MKKTPITVMVVTITIYDKEWPWTETTKEVRVAPEQVPALLRAATHLIGFWGAEVRPLHTFNYEFYTEQRIRREFGE